MRMSKFGRLNPGDFNPFFAKSEADSNNLRLIAVVTFISVIFIVVVYAILLAALNLKKVKVYKNAASPVNTTDVRPSICVSVHRSENSSFRGSISTNASGFARSSVGTFNAGLIATDINAAWKPLARVQSKKEKKGSFVRKLEKKEYFFNSDWGFAAESGDQWKG